MTNPSVKPPRRPRGRARTGYVRDRMQELADQGRLTARNADRHWLYEKSVQNPATEVPFVQRIFRREFGRRPTFLREDFCGTALLSAAWVQAHADHTALGVDLDGPTLAWGRANNLEPLGEAGGRVTLVEADVRNVRKPRCDVLMATNFSWWGLKTRAELGAYFRNCRASLRDEGMLLLDCYGGPEAQQAQIEERELDGFDYLWDQDVFNPITGETRCYIHFRFPDGSRLEKAFRYDWRLWSLPETCDLLTECGFREVQVYWEGTTRDGEPNGVFRPSRKGDLAPAWVAYILAFR
ncbi:MAG: class I SAM-dependent methyltransferase [Candidatus Krumholzibacteriia bacterium]